MVALAFAGCGSDDDENAPETTTPAVTAPTTPPTTPARPPTRDDPATAPSYDQDVPPSGEDGGTPVPNQDSPENDAPPPPGSPADKFEQQCRETPAACD